MIPLKLLLKHPVFSAVALLIMLGTLSAARAANQFEPQLLAVVNQHAESWLGDQMIIEALRARIANPIAGGPEEIASLDNQWREEAARGGGPLVDDIMGNELSTFLALRKSEADGLFTEISVIDAMGLNAGQSDLTSDYFQGDEANWQETFLVGPEATLVEDMEFDERSVRFQSQVSLSIPDPETGETIGVVTVGVAMEQLF